MNEEHMGHLTPRAQQVLALAKREADRFNHNFAGTEHLLLGLIRLGQGVAWNVLQKLGLDLDTVRLEVEGQMNQGPDQKVLQGPVPYTPRVMKVLSLAHKEARTLGHTYAGTEHLLLGLLLEGGGIAARVLKGLGLIDIEGLRRTILKELDPTYMPEEASKEELVRKVAEQKIGAVSTVQEIGDRFVCFLDSIGSPGLHHQDPRRRFVFDHIQLLLAAKYSFKGMNLESVLKLVCTEPTLDELIILCEILNIGGPNWLVGLQDLYNGSVAGSLCEVRVGRLLQVGTGQCPRKLGPPVDWLKDMRREPDSADIEVDGGSASKNDSAVLSSTPPPAPPIT